MNGFLSNLVARSFDVGGATALVRPRLPSLFEPAHPKWGNFPEMPAGSEPGEETGNSGRESARWADVPEAVRRRHNLRQETDPHGLSARPMTEGDRVPPPPAVKGAAIADKDRLGDNSGYETPLQYVSRASTQQLATSEIPARSTPMLGPDRQSDEVREELPKWSERPPRMIAAAENKVEEAEIGDRIKHSTIQARREGSESLMHAAQRPAFQPADAAAPPWEERKFRTATAKPEPTIQVTIGRIEVRAVMLGKMEKRNSIPSAMSLDDYLAGRRGGRS
jgi:hypothetical protein